MARGVYWCDDLAGSCPLRDQLIEAGYDVVLDCDQNTCGGFDFRFGTEVLPAPDMYVNIRAFRF